MIYKCINKDYNEGVNKIPNTYNPNGKIPDICILNIPQVEAKKHIT
jgi:hypothetical protein